jgi:hypothetical protein
LKLDEFYCHALIVMADDAAPHTTKNHSLFSRMKRPNSVTATRRKRRRSGTIVARR